MNKCDPVFCEGLKRGSHFLVSHFLGWGAGRGQGGVGVGGGWGGGGVSICLKRGHIFWCRTFWSGEWGCGGGLMRVGVVWV